MLSLTNTAVKIARRNVKKLLLENNPTIYYNFHARRMRKRFKKEFTDRQLRAKRRIYGSSPPYVLTGPFAEQSYLDEIVWGPMSQNGLELISISELHSIFDNINEESYKTVVDVGSAEGYYSVGLARILKSARVFSYDIDPWAREQQGELAALNGVTNISISGACDHNELTKIITKKTLLICDIEGYEYSLLNPDRCPALQECDILVEIHPAPDFTMNSGIEELARRFQATHRSTEFSVRPRETSGFSASTAEMIPTEDLLEYMNERRFQDQKWLWLQAVNAGLEPQGCATRDAGADPSARPGRAL